MTVKAQGKKWEVNDITYKQRRTLHRRNALSFWKGEIDPEKYYDLLEEVFKISGLTEEALKDVSMTDVDMILQEVFSAYMGLSKKVNGD